MTVPPVRSKAPVPTPARLALSARGRLSRAARLSGMGLQLAALAWTGAASAAPFGSPAWVAKHGNGAASGGVSTPVSDASAGAVVTPVEAMQRANRSIINLARTAEGIAAMQAAQSAAHQLAISSGPGCLTPNCTGDVHDGLEVQGSTVTSSSGLQVAADVPRDLANVHAGENAAHWINAQLPTQTVADGKTTVAVEQTDQRAVLYWDSFNIGRNTTLHFDQSQGTQSDGTNSWIALNKVGNSASPSQILGNMTADGSVYLINSNGILFGGSSQVNVHSLIATSLSPVADQVAAADVRFLDYAGTGSGVTDSSQPFFNSDSTQPYAVLTGDGSEGAIEIQAGAQIVTGSLGYSLIAGPSVRNEGTLIATDGQVVLAQGKGVRAEPPVSGSASNAMSVTVTGESDDPTAFLVNTGLIISRRGDITLTGLNIDQQGVLLASTSISRAGSISLNAGDSVALVDGSSTGVAVGGYRRYGHLRLGSGSHTNLLPDENGETTTSSAAATAAFSTGTITLTGGAITMQSGAQIEAPGQNVVMLAAPVNTGVLNLASLTGAVAGRIYVDDGAIIDVSGLNADQTALNDLAALEEWLVGAAAQTSSSAANSLTFEMSDNLVTIARVGQNELADSPLLRDSFLYRSSITVDRRVTGTNADGTTWTGTALANVLGYIEQVPRVVDELLINAGSVTLRGAEVLLRAGSVVNLSGGYVHYLGGTLETTKLVAANGAIFDIGSADPSLEYIGFAGTDTQTQSRWNITSVYGNSVVDGSGAVYQSAYIDGGNGGELTIGASDAVFLDGTIQAQAYAGRYQVANATQPQGGSLTVLGDVASGAGWFPGLELSGIEAYGHGIDVRSEAATLDTLLPGFDATTSLDALVRAPVSDDSATPWTDPTLLSYWTPLSASRINAMGLSSLTLVTGTSLRIEEGAALQVANGGSITLQGANVYIGASLVARSGDISVSTTGDTAQAGYSAYYMYAPTVSSAGAALAGDLEVAAEVTLDVSGLWVNDSGLDADSISGGQWTDGGSISLQTLTPAVTPELGVTYNQSYGSTVYAVSSGAGYRLVSGRRDVLDINDLSNADNGRYVSAGDLTGAVILHSGSLLDVSGGGRVAQNGELVASSVGIPTGKGGDITLRTYAGDIPALVNRTVTVNDDGSVSVQDAGLAATRGTLQLEGELRAYAFSGGGTLSLQALGIQIGDSDKAARDGTLQLSQDFFAQQGFGAYALTALYDATVTAGTTVTVSERNLLPTYDSDGSLLLYRLATGSSLYASAGNTQYVRVGSLDAYDREAADFSLTAGWYRLANSTVDYSGSGISGTLLVDEDAAIRVDAGGSIRLGSINQLTMLGALSARGGSVTLTGDVNAGAGYSLLDTDGILSTFVPYYSATKSIWLGANSLIDVSGIYLQNPRLAAGYGLIRATRTGTVLDGGRVTLTSDNGWIVALGCSNTAAACDGEDAAPGARILASGTTAVLDIGTGSLYGTTRAQTVASAGGTIRIGAGNGLYFNGSLQAAGGNASVLGGALYLTAENSLSDYTGAARRIVLSNEVVSLKNEILRPGTAVQTGSRLPGVLYFSTDRLDGAGIADLYIGLDDAIGLGRAVPVAFKANTQLSASRSIQIAASRAAVGNVPTASDVGKTSDVRISAPYVSLRGTDLGEVGAVVDNFREASSDITLQVNADVIDLGGQLALRNFGTASFNATQDIRFVTPSLHSDYSGASVNAGYLYSEGDLNFTAAQIYVATANRYIIASEGGTVTFAGNAQSADAELPLSAGGSLVVDARTIVQGGVLRVPQGEIVLGITSAADASLLKIRVNDGGVDVLLPFTATERVTLLDGSITSVSLDGRTVPYGTTQDGLNWTYDGSLGIGDQLSSSALPLSEAPAKSIRLDGSSLTLAEGATLDLSGGGDLQAQEFVAGTGGTKDVLAATNTVTTSGTPVSVSQYEDGRAIYAIIPGYSPSLAAYDPALVVGAPLVGKAVYLSGVEGLPAGVYTLLPAAYATLAGAYRVVQDTSSVDATASINSQLADGTQLVSGRYVDTLTGLSDARDTRFHVQSSEVWQQYSSYTLTSANDYFSAAAESAGTTASALPRDAAQLVLAATTQLTLGADILGDAAEGGSGARIDIASAAIEILADGATASDGYVGLLASDLTALAADSLLIGGTRDKDGSIDTIDAVASNILVSNGSDTLGAGEILLVATGASSTDGIRLQDGATLVASGTAQDATAAYAIGNSSRNGDGAYLYLGGKTSTLTRNNLVGSGYGVLSIGEGVTFTGSTLGFDATGTMQLGDGSGFTVDALSVTAPIISLLGTASTGTAAGFVVDADVLSSLTGAASLALRARSELSVLGDVDFSFDGALTLSAPRVVSDGGTASLSADTLRLANTDGSDTTAATSGSGTLSLDAQRIEVAGDDKRYSGFGSIQATATQGLVVQGSGITDFGAASVDLTTPLVLAASGADATLRTDGAMTLSTNGAATTVSDSSLGGALSLSAAALAVDTRLQASGGQLALSASGSGDALNLGARAVLDVSGSSLDYFDVSRQVSAGDIRLQAESGNLNVAAGALLNIAADSAGGDAGALSLMAGGTANLQGTIQGQRSSGTGAQFSLDSGGAVALDALAAQLASAGVDGAIAVRSGSGDLQLSATQQLAADAVALTAEAGTVQIDGSIVATGDAGGTITLYGRQGVDIQGTLDAHGSSATERGGTVVLGTGADFDSSRGYNADDGYQNIAADDAGVISLGENALIDVSGGTAGGLSGGVLKLRAPLLQDGELPVQLADGFDGAQQIVGAREISLEAYATWSTTDTSSGALHFDGIVDAAGRYDASGTAVDSIYAAHRDFYQTTLKNFVQQPRFAFEQRLAVLGAVTARPGIELVNPDGDIAVLSHWNLGAGTRNSDGSLTLDYRYLGSIAPVLSLRAAGDVDVQASITDGFFQYNNPFSGSTTNVDNSASPESISSNPLPLAAASLMARVTVDADGNSVVEGYDSSSFRIVAGADASSVDPLSLSRSAPKVGSGGGSGSLSLDGHDTGITFTSRGVARSVLSPTMIRTGVGSIQIAAAGDVNLLDEQAPGVIYTAGTPDPDAPAPSVQSSIQATDAYSSNASGYVYFVDSGLVNPVAAGDLSLSAGGSIRSVEHIVDTDGSRSGTAGTELGQLWWQWMDSDASLRTKSASRSSINFGSFNQGLLSAGGNISVSAGGDIVDLGVSSTASWYLDGSGGYALVGGGRLAVDAGGDILGGSYQVAYGSGTINAGGRIAANTDIPDGTTALATWLSVQHGQLSLYALNDLSVAGVYSDARLGYSADSALSLQSTLGDVLLEAAASLPITLAGDNFSAATLGGFGVPQVSIFPAVVNLSALSGAVSVTNSLKLTAAADGNLEIVAAGDVLLSSSTGERGDYNFGAIGLIDADESSMASPLNQLVTSVLLDDSDGSGSTGSRAIQQHSSTLLHADASEPVRIYSRDGDIVNGVETALGSYNDIATLIPNKPAYLRAGRDIVNLMFRGQNLKASDVSLIAAGRDLYDTRLIPSSSDLNQRVVSIEIGGPGTLIVESGRNLGALTSTSEARSNAFVKETPGVRSVGNLYNPWLTRGDGASLDLRYGIGPGMAVDAFAAAYIDPAVSSTYAEQLLAFVQRYQRDAGETRVAETAEAAWAVFEALPEEQRSLLVSAVFLDVLNQVGLDYNDSSSAYYKQYARGYEAIETLFPAAYGYTANSSDGSNGATQTVSTGEFDMRGSTVQTQQGGDIRVLGPGGRVLVGSQSAPAYYFSSGVYNAISPSQQGIITVQTGGIGIFADDSVLLAQSRIFTQQGGDLLIWSANGDVNAGQGAKTNTERASQRYICYQNDYCIVDARGQVSGAGIAALQTDPTQEAGDANLVAPRGTVDAGDAGIRAANLNIAALRIANADNVQVSGSSSGIPTGATDTGALASASSVAAAVNKTADDMAASKPVQTAATVITVEVVGFGSPSDEQKRSLR